MNNSLLFKVVNINDTPSNSNSSSNNTRIDNNRPTTGGLKPVNNPNNSLIKCPYCGSICLTTFHTCIDDRNEEEERKEKKEQKNVRFGKDRSEDEQDSMDEIVQQESKPDILCPCYYSITSCARLCNSSLCECHLNSTNSMKIVDEMEEKERKEKEEVKEKRDDSQRLIEVWYDYCLCHYCSKITSCRYDPYSSKNFVCRECIDEREEKKKHREIVSKWEEEEVKQISQVITRAKDREFKLLEEYGRSLDFNWVEDGKMDESKELEKHMECPCEWNSIDCEKYCDHSDCCTCSSKWKVDEMDESGEEEEPQELNPDHNNFDNNNVEQEEVKTPAKEESTIWDSTKIMNIKNLMRMRDLSDEESIDESGEESMDESEEEEDMDEIKEEEEAYAQAQEEPKVCPCGYSGYRCSLKCCDSNFTCHDESERIKRQKIQEEVKEQEEKEKEKCSCGFDQLGCYWNCDHKNNHKIGWLLNCKFCSIRNKEQEEKEMKEQDEVKTNEQEEKINQCNNCETLQLNRCVCNSKEIKALEIINNRSGKKEWIGFHKFYADYNNITTRAKSRKVYNDIIGRKFNENCNCTYEGHYTNCKEYNKVNKEVKNLNIFNARSGPEERKNFFRTSYLVGLRTQSGEINTRSMQKAWENSDEED